MAKLKIPYISRKAFAESSKEFVEMFKLSTHKVGAPPGTLTYTGKNEPPTSIKYISYTKGEARVEKIEGVNSLPIDMGKSEVHWIHVEGFKDIEKIRKVGERFNIDPLTMEDLLNISQLPKIEEHDDYVYFTFKLIDLIKEKHKIDISHFSMVAKDNVILTFSEAPNVIFDELEKQIRNPSSKLRSSSIHYLSYRIMDTIVDYYYYTMEWFTNTLSQLEIELVENPNKHHIHTILTYKKQWLMMRKSIYPLKDVMRKSVNTTPEFVKSTGKKYINDIHDHLQSIFETMEIIRETLDNLMDLYNSTLSNKMNEIMQVLTIVSTIFIPLTFIAGIYGMNFTNMPELLQENGYFYTLIAMLFIGILMLLYMKKRRWF
jgi:magnesium transporter